MPKGLQGFQKGHKLFPGAEKGCFQKGVHNNPDGEFKKGHPSTWTEETKIKMKTSMLGNKNGCGNKKSWEDINLNHKHVRIKKLLGKPNYCEICKRTDKKCYEWSNKNHKYSLKVGDWQRLCTSCHRKYDMKHNGLKIYTQKINSTIL